MLRTVQLVMEYGSSRLYLVCVSVFSRYSITKTVSKDPKNFTGSRQRQPSAALCLKMAIIGCVFFHAALWWLFLLNAIETRNITPQPPTKCSLVFRWSCNTVIPRAPVCTQSTVKVEEVATVAEWKNNHKTMKDGLRKLGGGIAFLFSTPPPLRVVVSWPGFSRYNLEASSDGNLGANPIRKD